MSASVPPTLVIHIPGQPAQRVELTGDSYSLGRSPECDLALSSSSVSRKHGLLEYKEGHWLYTDQHSQNGSYVEGQLVQQVALRDGVRIQLGRDPSRAVMLVFEARMEALADQTVEDVPLQEPTRLDGPDAKPPRRNEKRPSRPVSACPRCHVRIQAEARFCPSCGLNMTSADPEGKTAILSVQGAAPHAAAGAPEFIVQQVGEGLQRYSLGKAVMTIGRAADNDIVIASKLVSNRHLQVDVQSGQVTITDLNSTNGTQVNGRRIAPNQRTTLHRGDVIRVGDLTGNSLKITLGGSEGDIRSHSVGKLDLGKLATQPSVLIGRISTCDLVMPHPGVSKHHAIIRRRDGVVSIQDLGSTNGTYVNGVRIAQVNLKDGDEIRVGPFHLVYDAPQQKLAGSRRLGHRLDAVQLVKQVKGGLTILNNVSLSIQSTEFVALVGGSGAGKSTLMKALNGYEPATRGQILIDGENLYGKLDLYRTEMGYVPQDDIIHGELPVRLALWYAAKIRLPDATAGEIEHSIDESLRSVEMVEHQKKKVKELSGGQRKRVSIASELLAQPSLFFLDEPTSGLDPGLEKKMMYDLKRLADQGRTIVLVTHATSNIEQCDYVAFMSEGRLAYYGPPREAISFFGAQDFADIYQKLSQRISSEKGAPAELQAEYQKYLSAVGSNPQASSSHRNGSRGISAGVLWAEHFRRSPLYQQYVSARQLKRGDADLRPQYAKPLKPRGGSFLQQTWILALRQFDLIRHDLRTLFILLLMLPLIGLLFGASTGGQDWWFTGKGWENAAEQRHVITSEADADKVMKEELKGKPKEATSTPYTPVQNATTLVTMLALALTQGGTFAASYEIVKERAIFKRERAVNLSVWAYVLSKVLVLSLFALVQVGGVLLIIGLFVDLNVPAILFPDFSVLEIFISLYLAILASIALGLLISALVPSTDVVLYVILAQLFLQIVLTAALFPIDRNIASYMTPGYWATDSLASIVNIPDLDKKGRSCAVSEQPNETGAMELVITCVAAKSDQSNFAYYEHTREHLLQSWAAMGAQLAAFTLLTILVQSRKNSGKD